MGMVQYYAFDFAPRGWANCSGQLMSVPQNSALFSLLGTAYGGDGRSTFGLPDMRGRSITGMTNNTVGPKSGTESVTIPLNSMPLHTHTPTIKMAAFVDARNGGDSTDPTGAFISNTVAANMYATTPDPNTFAAAPVFTVGITGNSQPLNTLSPYLALTCCISLSGIFPSRS